MAPITEQLPAVTALGALDRRIRELRWTLADLEAERPALLKAAQDAVRECRV